MVRSDCSTESRPNARPGRVEVVREVGKLTCRLGGRHQKAIGQRRCDDDQQDVEHGPPADGDDAAAATGRFAPTTRG